MTQAITPADIMTIETANEIQAAISGLMGWSDSALDDRIVSAPSRKRLTVCLAEEIFLIQTPDRWIALDSISNATFTAPTQAEALRLSLAESYELAAAE